MASNLTNESERNDYCRDFMNHVCFRGKKCKFFHPSDINGNNPKKELDFCHDFQNAGCVRRNCRYIHCSKEEEEFYRSSGTIPAELQVCRDHLHGECRRTNCKFRHVTSQKRLLDSEDAPVPSRETYEPLSKIRPVNDYRRDQCGDFYAQLEEENQMLFMKIKELKKQVAYLTSHNEVLLEQNARLRMSRPDFPSAVRNNIDWSADLKHVPEGHPVHNGYPW